MVKTKTTSGRRERQERLGNVLWGLTLVGLGAYFTIQNRLGVLDLEPWRYWPMFLILAGLPPLLLPTDDANQAWGLLLTGAGVVFQLRSLDLIAWSITQAWPLLLIGAGVLLVVRSRRADAEAARKTENGDLTRSGQ